MATDATRTTATARSREEAIAALLDHEREIRARGVTRLALFGSFARNEPTADSDVDILVDIDRRRVFSLIDFIDLQDYMAAILGRPVDLMERDALGRPRLRDAVLRDVVQVFA
ncbi:MAG: nucleotidyltransferase family protein [Dongiaceae bacterium]